MPRHCDVLTFTKPEVFQFGCRETRWRGLSGMINEISNRYVGFDKMIHVSGLGLTSTCMSDTREWGVKRYAEKHVKGNQCDIMRVDDPLTVLPHKEDQLHDDWNNLAFWKGSITTHCYILLGWLLLSWVITIISGTSHRIFSKIKSPQENQNPNLSISYLSHHRSYQNL